MGLTPQTSILPLVPGTRHLWSGCPRAGLPAEAPGEGPPHLFQLLGAPGVRPWAGGHLPPVSTSVSMWLLLCVRVSPLLRLIRTLLWGLGPPLSWRASSQTLQSIMSAENFCPNKVRFSGSGSEDVSSLESRDSASYTGVVNAFPSVGVISYFQQWHFNRQGLW